MKMPIMLEISDKQVLVVGGGVIGHRKAKKFLDYGATVTCLSPKFIKDFDDRITCIKGTFEESYLHDFDIIIAATNDHMLNAEIYRMSNQLNKMCMTVDKDNTSDFDFMATRQNKNLTIGVSTNGGSPIYSKELVERLMNTVTKDDLKSLEKMIKERQNRLATK